jgi:hypothetical protein
MTFGFVDCYFDYHLLSPPVVHILNSPRLVRLDRTMAPPTSTLPSSHPLIAELTSLRQQLSQYQKSGHQSAIQLQGAKLELNLAKDEQAHLREANETLRSELQILRYVVLCHRADK